MPRLYASNPRTMPARGLLFALGLGIGIWSLGSSAAVTHAELDFDRTFSEAGEPASLYFKARYGVPGSAHTLELWRLGQAHLLRKTDKRIETYVARSPKDPEFQMTVLDRQRNIASHVSRTSLYKVGSFIDWFDLAHGLRRPVGPYELVRSTTPPGVTAPIEDCQWFELHAGNKTDRLCWSARYRIPLLIYSMARSEVVWSVEQVSTRPVSPSRFRADETGFVINNADRDIEQD